MRVPMTIVFGLVVGAAWGAAPESSGPPVIEYAKPIRLQVEWPGELDREALVILEFDVLASGKVTNIRPVDDGFHEKRFVRAATTALQKSRWQPRSIDGKPVDSPDMYRAFRFSFENMKPGITKEFQQEARKVEELLRKGDFAGGEAHAKWMLSSTVKLNYEYAILEAELAQIYAQMGRTADAVRKIARATTRTGARMEFLQLLEAPPPNSPSNYLLEKELIVQLLELRMRLLASQGLALEAMQMYYDLVGLEKLPANHPAVILAARLTAEIRGTGNLRGMVDSSTYGWRQFLSRRRFTIENVKGSIEGMTISCGANTRQITYQPGEEWVVPEGWGVCAVLIETKPGTTFEFVEFPDAPVPALAGEPAGA